MIEAGTSRSALRRAITRQIIVDTGVREDIAVQFANAAMAALDNRKAANGYVYVGARRRGYDLLQIRAALERGESIKRVMRDYSISRAKLYELFPGGLPVVRNRA